MHARLLSFSRPAFSIRKQAFWRALLKEKFTAALFFADFSLCLEGAGLLAEAQAVADVSLTEMRRFVTLSHSLCFDCEPPFLSEAPRFFLKKDLSARALKRLFLDGITIKTHLLSLTDRLLVQSKAEKTKELLLALKREDETSLALLSQALGGIKRAK